jgi:hypothetical protein
VSAIGCAAASPWATLPEKGESLCAISPQHAEASTKAGRKRRIDLLLNELDIGSLHSQ